MKNLTTNQKMVLNVLGFGLMLIGGVWVVYKVSNMAKERAIAKNQAIAEEQPAPSPEATT